MSIPTQFAQHLSHVCTEVLLWDDLRQTPEEYLLTQNGSVNTRLKVFILSVLVAFQSIRVLLVSLHKSTMHLY